MPVHIGGSGRLRAALNIVLDCTKTAHLLFATKPLRHPFNIHTFKCICVSKIYTVMANAHRLFTQIHLNL